MLAGKLFLPLLIVSSLYSVSFAMQNFLVSWDVIYQLLDLLPVLLESYSHNPAFCFCVEMFSLLFPPPFQDIGSHIEVFGHLKLISKGEV